MLIVKCICSYGDCNNTIPTDAECIYENIIDQLRESGWSMSNGGHMCEEHTEAIKEAGEPE
jgi:hypothetical protein